MDPKVWTVMDLNALIAQFGLIALFLGCFLEGESAAITGGVLAHGGFLPLWQVVIAIAAGWSASAVFRYIRSN